jgi:hypothetical protein
MQNMRRLEGWGIVAATLAAAISRLFALARTPWDWDELLFMEALDHYDVAVHRPHPPGFPLYILAAKIIRKLGFGDFHALQALSVLAAMAIVPAMYFLCRALGMRFATSISAALILAFFPNVWFYGGGALSDVPSMVLVMVAVALLLRGRLLLGATALAIAAGFRPQNLLIGIAPLLIASWRDKRRAPIAAAILVVIVGASFGVAAWLTGWSRYAEALREHSAYITSVDSFHSPTRPALWRVFGYFLVRPYRAPVINIAVTLFAAISVVAALWSADLRSAVGRPLVGRLDPGVAGPGGPSTADQRSALLAIATFAPFCFMAVLYLDHFSASRFSIGYAPLVALLAADGIALAARRFEPLVAGALIAIMIAWTWPSIAAVRHSVAPPVAAVDWLRNHADPEASVIYVDEGMIPYAEWYLPEYHLRFVYESGPPPLWSASQVGYFLREAASNVTSAQNFVRPHGRLWDLVRRRYFEVSVRPISEHITFGDGWYDEEGAGREVWRWMGGRSAAQLPAISGDARLTLTLYAPLDALPVAPNVVIRVNGVVVDRFAVTSRWMNREMIVHARGDAINELVIETDRVVKPPRDTRVLGLRLNALGWLPTTD